MSDTWAWALAADIVAAAGISLEPDAIHECRVCSVRYRRRNRLRHLRSTRHRLAFRRAWERTHAATA